MNRDELIQKLIRFKDKAFCTYTHEQASSIWRQIREHIPDPYNHYISVEWSHIKCGHGLQQECLALDTEISKYIDYLMGINDYYKDN